MCKFWQDEPGCDSGDGNRAIRGIKVMPAPLATVIFTITRAMPMPRNLPSASLPNNKVREVERLVREYRISPQGVKDIVLLTPEAKLSERRVKFPGLEIHPIKFSSGELGAESWKFRLGAYDDSLYVRQLVTIMRRHRENLVSRDQRGDRCCRARSTSSTAGGGSTESCRALC